MSFDCFCRGSPRLSRWRSPVQSCSGLSADHFRDYALAAVVASLVGAIVRPVMVAVASRIGWVAVLALAIVGQAVILQVALELVPGIQTDSFGASLAARMDRVDRRNVVVVDHVRRHR